jgi:putative ABC transport system ATP-binding protein
MGDPTIADASTKTDEPHEAREPTVPGHSGSIAEPIVELERVSRIYHLGHVDVPALVDASLTVGRGEFVAIVGPSGSGKSTLMNLIGCLDRPSSGVYRLAGTPVSSLNDDALAHVRSRLIGFVFQSYNLLPRTTALENVATPLMYQGVGRRDRHARAAAALERLGLADRMNHVPNELSGGQQQRVAIARALVTDPALILADEPTGNLDSHSGAEVIGILHELHASGRTIVLITHDSNVAAAASRRVLIADGQLSLPDEAWAA